MGLVPVGSETFPSYVRSPPSGAAVETNLDFVDVEILRSLQNSRHDGMKTICCCVQNRFEGHSPVFSSRKRAKSEHETRAWVLYTVPCS